ncbi:hypothetical protein EYC84_008906 [Monilinia fructicola]|uniref:RRM domain-containing protein n=1 Tax=Monilinia fructicola TaxID=38448 RepID=A0A5M9JF42_MONFR|nr:hypothetical protein EYC84_008906 [Monilinia fructicola]
MYLIIIHTPLTTIFDLSALILAKALWLRRGKKERKEGRKREKDQQPKEKEKEREKEEKKNKINISVIGYWSEATNKKRRKKQTLCNCALVIALLPYGSQKPYQYFFTELHWFTLFTDFDQLNIQWLTILIDHKERDLVHLADNVLAAQDVINVVVHTLLAVALAAATNIAENDRRSRSPMSGAAGVGGSGGSAYGGQPHRTYEERAAAREQMMSSLRESSQQDRRVYVGNLSYDVKWHHLKDFMRSAGEVLFADVLLLPNGMSKVGAYTIVEYATREQAQQAVNTLSNQNLMGRLVYVREDREAEPRFTGTPAGGRGGYEGNGPPGGRGGFGGGFGGGMGPGGGAGGGGRQFTSPTFVSIYIFPLYACGIENVDLVN